MRTVGVDLAAEAGNTALATICWDDAGAVVVGVSVGCDDDAIVAAAAGAGKVGIDCPFGWPRSYLELLMAHQNGHITAPPGISGLEWRRGLAYRETDLVVWREHGHRPLSVAADLIAYPAMRCAGLLGTLAAAGHDVDRCGGGLVAETYPAASLRRWGLPHRGYKGPRGAAVRERLVEALRQPGWLDLGPAEQLCLGVDHALDAVVAALTARACALGLTTRPSAAARAAARVEGWIAVPTVALAALAPVPRTGVPPGRPPAAG